MALLRNYHYQEQSDQGVKLGLLLLELARAPSSLSRSQWRYLNTIPISTIAEEARISRVDAAHIANQIDRVEADVSRMGKFEHFSDALMMWLIAASFTTAGILLALLAIPESIGGRTMIPVSLGLGVIFLLLPFIQRHRALQYDKDCFHSAVINILGNGLMRRSVLTTDALIREINRQEPKAILLKVVEKYLSHRSSLFTKAEEIHQLEQLLEGFGMRLSELPFPIVQQVDN